MATEIQGINIKVQYREVGDTDWKTLVCEIDSQFQHTNDVQETDTKCGTFNGIKEMKGNYSGNAVYNVLPGVTEGSYMEILALQRAKTLVELLIENESYVAEDGSTVNEGEALHIFARGRFVDTTLQGASGDIGKFSWTFKPNGLPTISGSSS